jgi:cyclohexadienyl dehydratase
VTRPRIELCAALVFCALFADAVDANDSVDVLMQIHQSRTVRVATTGDYRPFSYYLDGSRAGIDVDLAAMLANELGVTLVWVDTSWTHLLGDLTNQRFDIAMGGISVTAERAAAGRFSTPYLTTGKTILARCAVQQRFVTLAQLNQSNATVIVNPGGTNEQFVRAHLPHAHVIVNPDNETIFDALAAGAADAMITDAIEARLEAAAHHELCLPTGTLFAQVEKAYLMPADDAWQSWVDAWLERIRADGRLDAITRRYLPAPPP